MKQKKNLSQLISIMLALFTMGFVDLVGIATNYIKRVRGAGGTSIILPGILFPAA